ncbi:MAG: GNAT family N-acetyltransferase [Balneolaceae bacterium]|nr:GNAT family N-acetyltransferase [Balneolaceae bacterium]
MQPPISTGIEDFSIRFADEGDTPLVMRFIRELAAYEKLLDEVVADEQMLHAHLFGEQPRAEVLIGEEGGEPAGFALFFHTFSTFLGRPGLYLEDLYVRPECRGRGYGRALLGCLARLAVERGCGRLEWAVLNWNEPAIGFYESLDARPMDDWTVYRLTGEPLQRLSDAFEKGEGSP